MHRAMREFFALPLEAKREIERTATNSWGFYDRELTKNTRDWKQIFDVGPDESDGPLAGQLAQWPTQISEFRSTMMAFYDECIVQVWSNDRYPAALHRVIANRAERYSAPFFFNPAPEATYAPLTTSEPARYRPIQWGEFRANRSAGDYADHGEEVQIAHYRISAR